MKHQFHCLNNSAALWKLNSPAPTEPCVQTNKNKMQEHNEDAFSPGQSSFKVILTQQQWSCFVSIFSVLYVPLPAEEDCILFSLYLFTKPIC